LDFNLSILKLALQSIILKIKRCVFRKFKVDSYVLRTCTPWTKVHSTSMCQVYCQRSSWARIKLTKRNRL